jgi:hypothetical protein
MEQLKPYNNWVVTYLHDKIPLNPKSMQKASTTDPFTWTDYATAEACVRFNPQLVKGFVLTNTPYSAVDLDTYKTTDQRIMDKHKAIYERFRSYSELSPRGGVHIIVEAQLSENKKLPNQYIELLSTGKYITMTGKALNGELIHSRQLEMNELFYHITEQQTRIHPMMPDEVPEEMPDSDVIKAAADAQNGELFKQLYQGNWQDIYPTQSEADQAFVDIVAFYTNSKLQVGRIFHQSQLGKRAKANRKDYLYHPKYGIITRSFDQKKPNVTYENIEEIIKNVVYAEAKKEISVPIIDPSLNGKNGYHSKLNRLPDFIQKDVIQFDFDPPPGMLGQVAQFIYNNAVYPVKEIAISAAIAFMSGICGRAYNISDTGLNHYLVVLAPTGGGKEGAASGIERFSSYIREKNPLIDQFLGAADIASPQALIRHLSNISPCFMSQKGEMGLWMQKITDKHARPNETGMRQILLDLFMKSGHKDTFRGSIYSDKGKDIKPIQSPCFSLFGDATPHTFYRSVDEENVEEGFVSRFCIIECDMEEYPLFNESHGTIDADDRLVNQFAVLIRKVTNMHTSNTVLNIDETPEAHDAQMDFLNECHRKTRDGHDTPEGRIYSRAHLRVLRLAGLVAVGNNPNSPVLTPDCVEWARKFIVSGIAKVSWRFEQGEVGERTAYLEQQKTLRQFLFKYWNSGWNDVLMAQFGITKEMYNAKIITRRYLQGSLMSYAPFRKSRNPSWEFELALKALQECGVLWGIDMGKIRQSGKVGTAYYITDYEALKEPVQRHKKKEN